MVPSSTSALADLLRQSGILTQAQIDTLDAELLPSLSDDPQELAYALVQRGWITSYQADQLLQGKSRQLVLEGYWLLEPLGSGGMGQVFRAWEKRLNRIVALKVLRPELAAQNPSAVRRFKREALAAKRLNHPNIVPIYDFGESAGANFIVMEYIDGPDLERLVLDGGPLPLEVASDYTRQAALGLQHAHEARLVHRDIKPDNLLMVTQAVPDYPHGLIKILDMGLARIESASESGSTLTLKGAMMGTPDFCSPEQARDAANADIRSDLYSLGCTFYFLLSGQPPFPGGEMIDKLLKHRDQEPVPIEQLRPDTPPALSALIRQLMAKDPNKRLQTPIELAQLLVQLS